MATLRRPGSVSTAIQQTVAAGVAFDGVIPANASPLDCTLDDNGLYRYPEAQHAGLFYWDANEPVICGQFHVSLNGSGNASLYIVNLDKVTKLPIAGESILVEEATGVSFIALDESKFKVVLLARQALQLVTSVVNGQKQIAQAVGSIERTYVR